MGGPVLPPVEAEAYHKIPTGEYVEVDEGGDPISIYGDPVRRGEFCLIWIVTNKNFTASGCSG